MKLEDFCALAYSRAFDARNVNSDYIDVLVGPTSDHLVLEEELWSRNWLIH